MIIQTRVKSGEYYDSVTLLGIAQALANAEKIINAAVVMGTPANKEFLRSADLLSNEAQQASPNDLVIVVAAATEQAALSAIQQAITLLKTKQAPTDVPGIQQNPRTFKAALQNFQGSNIVLISVAGQYAAAVAKEALQSNHHVFLFSDNVSIEDEVDLKEIGKQKGLLVMGPDAGTSIINGAAMGFANSVPRGPVGCVSASGTGLQSVTCSLAHRGIGISQAIGVGGRDLSAKVGGVMMVEALKALVEDDDTEVIVLISKPPAASVSMKILDLVAASTKPTVICFLGAKEKAIRKAGAVHAQTLEEAALFAEGLLTDRNMKTLRKRQKKERKKLRQKAEELKALLNEQQTRYRGLFSGGTFCYETQEILGKMLGIDRIRSNAPVRECQKPAHATEIKGHLAIDLGADEYTMGRLHPMLDPTFRNQILLKHALDPKTAVLYLDIVLGFGVHPDPAGAVVPVILEAQSELDKMGRHVIFTASVCGTPTDPQNAVIQEEKLKQAGVTVLSSNARAAYLAGYILS